MMRLLIPVIIALIGLGGGVGAAIFLRPAAEPVGEVADAATPCGDPGADAATDGHANVGGGVETENAESGAHVGDSEYTELGDQFVVPVVQDGSIQALVVLSLSVETAPGFGPEIIAHTPKLGDIFLRELLDHANLGGFKGAFTSNGTLDRLRMALREAGQKAMGAELRDVLILDINRQDLS